MMVMGFWTLSIVSNSKFEVTKRSKRHLEPPLVYTFKSCRLDFYSAIVASGSHSIGFIILLSFTYVGIRDLVC
jgi:hypothetical protein